jgi:hypothetical protein
VPSAAPKLAGKSSQKTRNSLHLNIPVLHPAYHACHAYDFPTFPTLHLIPLFTHDSPSSSCIKTHMPIFKIVIVSGSTSASASSRTADFPISAKAKAPHSSPAVSDGACAKARHDCATGSSLCFRFRLGSRSRKHRCGKEWLGSQSGRVEKSQSRLRELSGSLLFCRRPKRIINAVC